MSFDFLKPLLKLLPGTFGRGALCFVIGFQAATSAVWLHPYLCVIPNQGPHIESLTDINGPQRNHLPTFVRDHAQILYDHFGKDHIAQGKHNRRRSLEGLLFSEEFSSGTGFGWTIELLLNDHDLHINGTYLVKQDKAGSYYLPLSVKTLAVNKQYQIEVPNMIFKRRLMVILSVSGTERIPPVSELKKYLPTQRAGK